MKTKRLFDAETFGLAWLTAAGATEPNVNDRRLHRAIIAERHQDGLVLAGASNRLVAAVYLPIHGSDLDGFYDTAVDQPGDITVIGDDSGGGIGKQAATAAIRFGREGQKNNRTVLVAADIEEVLDGATGAGTYIAVDVDDDAIAVRVPTYPGTAIDWRSAFPHGDGTATDLDIFSMSAKTHARIVSMPAWPNVDTHRWEAHQLTSGRHVLFATWETPLARVEIAWQITVDPETDRHPILGSLPRTTPTDDLDDFHGVTLDNDEDEDAAVIHAAFGPGTDD